MPARFIEGESVSFSGGLALVSVSPRGQTFFSSASSNKECMACVCEGDVASVPDSPSGNVTSESVSLSRAGVASVPVTLNKGGVTVPVKEAFPVYLPASVKWMWPLCLSVLLMKMGPFITCLCGVWV